jgi:hypothetical protein
VWNRIHNEEVQCVITLEWLKHGHKYMFHLYTNFTNNLSSVFAFIALKFYMYRPCILAILYSIYGYFS